MSLLATVDGAYAHFSNETRPGAATHITGVNGVAEEIKRLELFLRSSGKHLSPALNSDYYSLYNNEGAVLALSFIWSWSTHSFAQPTAFASVIAFTLVGAVMAGSSQRVRIDIHAYDLGF